MVAANGGVRRERSVRGGGGRRHGIPGKAGRQRCRGKVGRRRRRPRRRRPRRELASRRRARPLTVVIVRRPPVAVVVPPPVFPPPVFPRVPAGAIVPPVVPFAVAVVVVTSTAVPPAVAVAVVVARLGVVAARGGGSVSVASRGRRRGRVGVLTSLRGGRRRLRGTGIVARHGCSRRWWLREDLESSRD